MKNREKLGKGKGVGRKRIRIRTRDMRRREEEGVNEGEAFVGEKIRSMVKDRTGERVRGE